MTKNSSWQFVVDFFGIFFFLKKVISRDLRKYFYQDDPLKKIEKPTRKNDFQIFYDDFFELSEQMVAFFCSQNNSKSYGWNGLKFLEKVSYMTIYRWFSFGLDPDYSLDPGRPWRLLIHLKKNAKNICKYFKVLVSQPFQFFQALCLALANAQFAW